MNSGKIKILVGDDHSVVRNGVIKSLTENFPGAQFGEASNAAEILNLVQSFKWDLIILDISMPGRNGMEVLKEVKERQPETPVIIFSMYPEDQFALRAIKAGASAYLTKDIPLKVLAEAIKKILKGEKYLTSSLAQLMANELSDNVGKPVYQTLSDREHQVFLLISGGKNVSDIARELNLSVKTISVYRSIILKKMNLKNNAEITHYAFKNNLVE